MADDAELGPPPATESESSAEGEPWVGPAFEDLPLYAGNTGDSTLGDVQGYGQIEPESDEPPEG